MSGVFHDFKHGARMLIKNPGFTVIAVISIAIGVGANAAMFSVADGLVLRPLPVPRAGEVVTVSAVLPAGVGLRSGTLSYPDYTDIRDQTRTLRGVVAYQLVLTSFITRPDEQAQRRAGMAVSANYFDAMEIRPALGRWFRADEDLVEGRDAVMVLDYDEWQQRFASDLSVIDRHLKVGGQDFTVIGVAPAGFTSIDHDLHPAFYIPLAMSASVQSGVPPDTRTRRDFRTLTVKGRLQPASSMAEARLELQQIAQNLDRSHPETNRNVGLTVRTQYEAFAAGPGGTDATLVAMLMTLALVVLIVACANVGGLLTSRAPVRTREMALRLALGAGRTRVIRQLVTESLLVAMGGGLCGLLFGYGVIAMFRKIEYPTDIPLKLTYALDTRAIAVGIVVAAAAAVLSSLVPAWQASRTDLVSTIKDPSASASRRHRLWGRSVLVSAQIALSLVLLTVATFLYQSFQAGIAKGPGFRTDHVLMVTFEPGLVRYDASQRANFYRSLKEAARAMPGVTSVALTSAAPMKGGDVGFALVAPEGFQFQSGATNVGVVSIDADESYFSTLAIPIVAGRAFQPTDTMDRPRVAVVNETFAAHYWPGQNPVGKRLRLDSAGGAVAEVVGVAATAKYFFILESPNEFIYFAHAQGAAPRATLLVGTTSDAAALAERMRSLVRSIDPNMPLFGVRTLEDFYASRIIYTSQLIVGTVTGMGSMGLVLALVGLYSLVTYNVRRRTREIGIRVAVGASPAAVLRMVMRNGAALVTGGLAAGLVVSVAANNALSAAFSATAVGFVDGRFNGVAIYAQTIVALIVIVMLAAYVPARRAARVDPLVALKSE